MFCIYHCYPFLFLLVFFCFFVFFKQKTAYEMRISDWSSDVCSSDLQNARRNAVVALGALYRWLEAPDRTRVRERVEELLDDRWLRVQLSAVQALQTIAEPASIGALNAVAGREIGRASWRDRVVSTCRSRWAPSH